MKHPRFPMLLLVLAVILVSLGGMATLAADRIAKGERITDGGDAVPFAWIDGSDVVTVTPAPGAPQPRIVDGGEGNPPAGARPGLQQLVPEVVYVQPNPAPGDPGDEPPATVWHCASDAGDCGRAVANACNATGHGSGTSSKLAWCPNGTAGQFESCCTGACSDGATVTCTAG